MKSLRAQSVFLFKPEPSLSNSSVSLTIFSDSFGFSFPVWLLQDYSMYVSISLNF